MISKNIAFMFYDFKGGGWTLRSAHVARGGGAASFIDWGEKHIHGDKNSGRIETTMVTYLVLADALYI